MNCETIEEHHPDYVTVTYGLRGWFCVYLTWTDDPVLGGFYEPTQTGIGSYKTKDDPQLLAEGKDWAEDLECAFKALC